MPPLGAEGADEDASYEDEFEVDPVFHVAPDDISRNPDGPPWTALMINH